MAAIHALIFALEGPGHLNPLFELAERLVHEHDFKFTAILSQAALSHDPKLFRLERNHPGIRFVGIDDGRPEGGFKSMDEKYDALDRMRKPIEETLRTINPPADFIISDEFVGCWMQDVADKFSIPRVGFCSCSTACEIVCFHIPMLVSKGYLPVKANMEDTSLITFMPGIPPVRRTDLPLCFYEESRLMHVVSDGCSRTPEAFCVLANTCKELEPEAVSVNQEKWRYFPVGPLLPSALFQDKPLPRDKLSEEDLSCMDWLDAQPPASILYIAFGSVAVFSAAQVEHILQALEASKQGFLWVFRENFVTDSPEGLQSFVSERVKALKRGRMTAWAPQMHVLRHAAIGGFVTHCGWNSTMEAVCSGIPLLAWPCTSEQNMNAKLIVEKWKIGLEVSSEGQGIIVDSQKIVKLISEVMNGGQVAKDLKSNVIRLRNLVRAAMKGGGSSHSNLLAFVECIKGQIAKVK